MTSLSETYWSIRTQKCNFIELDRHSSCYEILAAVCNLRACLSVSQSVGVVTSSKSSSTFIVSLSLFNVCGNSSYCFDTITLVTRRLNYVSLPRTVCNEAFVVGQPVVNNCTICFLFQQRQLPVVVPDQRALGGMSLVGSLHYVQYMPVFSTCSGRCVFVCITATCCRAFVELPFVYPYSWFLLRTCSHIL